MKKAKLFMSLGYFFLHQNDPESLLFMALTFYSPL